jgi:hypothetical protein
MRANLLRHFLFKEGRREEGLTANLPQPLFSKEGRRAKSLSRNARRISPFEKGGCRGIRFLEASA